MTSFAPESPPEKGSILLVDDLPENLQLLSELLMSRGYGVRSVTGGRMALRTVQVKPPDLILLDLKMPDIDGYQVCAQLKTDPNFQEIPIIFISALDETVDKVRAFQLGAVDYITKPFQPEEVLARVENQLTIQRQRQTLQQEIQKRREVEEVLYQSRALLASVLNASLDGIAALEAIRDPETGTIRDFRCLVVNPVMARAFGQRGNTVVGKPVFKPFLADLDPQLFPQFVAVVETGEPLEQDVYCNLEGACWFHFVAVKLGDGFAVIVRDITHRKRIELELQAANEQLHGLAHRDSLTQIANRRCFDQTFQRQWHQACAESQSLAVVLIDVDYFRHFNDVYGHHQGDDCLRRVAQAIEGVLPTGGLVARYGGEEFGVVLPQMDETGAIAVGEQVQKAVEGLKIPHGVSDVSEYVTVSLGIVAEIPSAKESPQDWLDRGDKALHQAKQQGRNRWVVESMPQLSESCS